MFVVARDQIPLDLGVQGRLSEEWVFLYLAVNVRGARSAQEIADQHAALAVHEPIDRDRLLAFEFHHANWIQVAPWA